MTKEQFLSGTVFRWKPKNTYSLWHSTYYFDGVNVRCQKRDGLGEVTFDILGQFEVKVGRTGYNCKETNQLGTRSRVNFEDLEVFVPN
jgi:hypothetical protein